MLRFRRAWPGGIASTPVNSHHTTGVHTSTRKRKPKPGVSVYGATPETFKLLGRWAPPHHQTSSYHCKCMVFPIVEGRLFMRGFDGIHCYDLRKKD